MFGKPDTNTDPELDELKREAAGEEQEQGENEAEREEQYIESTERRLRRLFKGLEHLPQPLDFDRDEQTELAELWAPIAKDYEFAAGPDAPAWIKWATALVGTTVIGAPKILMAYAMVQQQKAGEGQSERAAAAEDPDSETEAEQEAGSVED